MKRFRAAPVLRLLNVPRPSYHSGRAPMRRTLGFVFWLFHFLVLCCTALGQDLAPPAFYPLAVGNFWVYLEYGTMSVPDTITIEAYADTVIESVPWIRIHWVSARYQNHSYWEERVDSAGDVWSRRYEGVILKYRLSDTSATFWQSGTGEARFDSCVGGEYIGVTGNILYVNYWRPGDTAAAGVAALGERIGFLYSYPYGLVDGSFEQLAGAWIDGRGYGILATETTLDSASLALYPLHIGDRWTYRAGSTISAGYSWVVNVDVVGDSLFLNGFRYFTLTRTSVYEDKLYWERVDSATTIVYHIDTPERPEERYDSLAASPGDILNVNRGGLGSLSCDRSAYDSVLGIWTNVKSFSVPVTTVPVVPTPSTFRFASGLGVASYFVWLEDPNPMGASYREDLVYARINGVEYGTPVGLETTETHIPGEFALEQNYPNPFNPSTTIRYGLPERSHVTLTVFNTLGQQVAVLQNGEQQAGYHELQFEASHLASGVYLYRLTAGSFVETRKLILVR